MSDKVRLTPTNKRGNLVLWVDEDDWGWCRFSGGAELRCRNCNERVSAGYIPFGRGDARCENCVEITDYGGY